MTINMNFPTCYILVGLPHCGRREAIAELCEHQVMTGVTVIDYDAVVAETASRENNSLEVTYRRHTSSSIVIQMAKRIMAATRGKRSILISADNLRIKDRGYFLRFIPASYNKVAIVLRFPDTAEQGYELACAGSNPQNFTIEDYQEMLDYYQIPDASQFDAVIHHHTCPIQ